MTVYQLHVKGYSACFDVIFKCSNKTVYKHEPTEAEKQKFVEACTDDSYLDYLDDSKPYEVQILPLELKE